MKALAQKVISQCRELAQHTEEPGRITRTFLSEPMRGVHRLVGDWMREAGLTVHLDGLGNLCGRTQGNFKNTRPFLLGSHLDTVPNSGAFDGILGVVLAVALIGARLRPLPFPVEVLGFSEEEGVRFRFPFLGSLAYTGRLHPHMLEMEDSNGVSVRAAIRAYGLPQFLPNERNALGYLEFHIEQGPVLESLDLPLGVVDAISGQSRYELAFEGKANHAGTTPMSNRRNALTAAAEWIGHVERYAAQHPGLVATNGAITVEPNATNVVPGLVRVSLDVRHAEDAVRLAATAELLGAAETIGDARGIRTFSEAKLDQPATPMDPELTAALARSVARAGFPIHHMTSGAGHDAMILAPVFPSAMLFLRSPGGISHHPDEDVLVEDVEAALHSGLAFFDELEALYA